MSNVESLITEHIDTWTSAVKTKSSAGRGSSNKRELYGIKKLRELILQLAVRGLLVPQCSKDQPASLLTERLKLEKEQKIKDKKIKKLKALPDIPDGEKLFKLPAGWEWCRLQDVIDVRDGTHDSPKDAIGDNTFPLITSKNFSKGRIDFENARRISEKDHLEISKRSIVEVDDILFSMIGGNIGNQVIVTDSQPFSIKNVALFKYYDKLATLPKFIKIFTEELAVELQHKASGGAQPFVSLGALRKLVIALPPASEQKKIIAKFFELISLCDQLEQQTDTSIDAHETLISTLLKALTDSAASTESGAEQFQQAWNRIAENFDVLFTTESSIGQLKQTILQLAVMGKLVPQGPNDEPASAFLEKIAAEKEKLVKDKTIKKQKSLPSITEDEKPFELPVGWEFERIGTFGIVGTGATPSRTNSAYWNPAEINWVSSGETSELFVGETKEKVSELAVKETNVSIYPPGTLIVAMYGQGKTRGQISELLEEAGTNQACAAIRLVDKATHHKDYVKLYFRKSYAELRRQAAGGAQPNLNVGKIANTILAMPPLAEQERIVSQAEKLLSICDALKEKINCVQSIQLNIADAITYQSLN